MNSFIHIEHKLVLWPKTLMYLKDKRVIPTELTIKTNKVYIVNY